MKYENLKYSDDILPVIFRKDTRESHMSPMLMHWHKAVELLLILEGEAVIQSNDETAVARKGDVVCVHSGHLHGYTPLGESCTYYCLILPPEVIGSKQLYEAPLPLICNRKDVAMLFEKIVSILEAQPPFFKESAKCRMVQLYISLASAGGNQLPGTDRRMTTAVKSALEYIEAHYSEELNIDRIARAVGISRYHLCHIFKEITGNTPATYWQNVRCSKARKMLKRGASVAEAAETCGFSSPGYFARIYQKHYGVLPSNDKL